MAKERLFDIDRAKGLAIFLVVLGHLVARVPPEDNEWFVAMVDAVYQFHMPFFMFLSGVVLGHTLPKFTTASHFGSYFWKKVIRLAPAYLFFGLLVLSAKIIAVNFIHVDNRPDDFFSGLLKIFVDPLSSCSSSLWYIYTLLLFYAIMPLAWQCSRPYTALFLLVAFGLHFVPATDDFLLSRFCEYAVFVGVGIAISQNYQQFAKVLDKHRWLFISLFGVAITIWFGWDLPKWLVGMLSIPALMCVVRDSHVARSRSLVVLGQYCFVIYLLNTITIGVTKAIMLKFVSWDGINFLIYLPTLLMAGLVAPIYIKRIVFTRVPFLDRITM